MLATISPEQRQDMLRKAAENREAAKEFATENLRNDFADKLHWRRLASKYGVKMPAWYVRNTRTIRRALRILGFDGSWVHDTTGCISLKELMDRNPSWPSYAFVGLILETKHEQAGSGDLPELDEDLVGDEPDDEEDLVGDDDFEDTDLLETVIIRLPADQDDLI